MRIAIPKLHVADCRHIQITKDIGTGGIEIDFDSGALVIMAGGPPETGMPELEIIETDSQAGGEDDEQTP
jgi:hypothetical protein